MPDPRGLFLDPSEGSTGRNSTRRVASWTTLGLTSTLIVFGLLVTACGNSTAENTATAATSTTTTVASTTTTTLAPTTTITVAPSTTTTVSTTTSTTVPELPSYEDVLATYPEGVVLCSSEAEVNGQSPDGTLDVTIRAGTLLIGDELQFPCWGMRFHVLADVTLDGKQYHAGSVLVVGPDADPSFLSTAAPPAGVSSMLVQPVTGTWDYTGGMDWLQING